jgi:GNAT superfamily N-acetyltransferase
VSALATVRPIRETSEIASVDPVRERAGFGAVIVEEMRWIRAIGAGEVFVAEEDGVTIGAGAALSLGATGWIGGVCVVPEARRRGLGGALTAAGVAWLRDRGVGTVLLYATELGRPIYERLGFVADGAADLWSGRAPEPVYLSGLRAGGETDLDAALALDRAATGEDRGVIARRLWSTRAFVFAGEAGLRGAAIGGRFGGGTVVAADDEAGRALLVTSLAAQVGEVRAAVPSTNAAAAETLSATGFRPELTTPRMRLGPPVAARPQRLFRLFNLFWG